MLDDNGVSWERWEPHSSEGISPWARCRTPIQQVVPSGTCLIPASPPMAMPCPGSTGFGGICFIPNSGLQWGIDTSHLQTPGAAWRGCPITGPSGRDAGAQLPPQGPTWGRRCHHRTTEDQLTPPPPSHPPPSAGPSSPPEGISRFPLA